MTTDSVSDEAASPAEFEAALGRLLATALENDVDPRGAWECRTDGSSPDVEVVVVELAD